MRRTRASGATPALWRGARGSDAAVVASWSCTAAKSARSDFDLAMFKSRHVHVSDDPPVCERLQVIKFFAIADVRIQHTEEKGSIRCASAANIGVSERLSCQGL